MKTVMVTYSHTQALTRTHSHTHTHNLLTDKSHFSLFLLAFSCLSFVIFFLVYVNLLTKSFDIKCGRNKAKYKMLVDAWKRWIKLDRIRLNWLAFDRVDVCSFFSIFFPFMFLSFFSRYYYFIIIIICYFYFFSGCWTDWKISCWTMLDILMKKC